MNRSQRRAAAKTKSRRAVAEPRPADGEVRAAIGAYQAGRIGDAGRACARALAADPRHPVALHLAGIVKYREGDPAAAVDLLRAAAQAAPRDPEVRDNLGKALKALGDLDGALGAYQAAIAIDRNFAEAYSNMGNTLRALGRTDEAVAAYEAALKLKPNLAETRNNLGNALMEQRRPEDAEAAYRAAIRLAPGLAEAHANLGSALRQLGRYEAARLACDEALFLNHGRPWTDTARLAEPVHEAAAIPMGPRVSAFKLEDTIEQLEYLIACGKLAPSFAAMVDRIKSLHEDIVRADPAQDLLTVEQAARVGAFYNRLIHYGAAPRVGGPAINGALDFAALEAAYLDTPAPVVVFDDLLTQEALHRLRQFCLESTIFFDHSGERFVSARVDFGFNADILYQIAEELRANMPRLFAAHPLNTMWVYRHRNQGEGVEVHTDKAAVTLNFWITPDAANLAPERGGLVVYAKEQPADWDWRYYNDEQYTPEIKARIAEFLADADARTVPYRDNRAVLFHSNLFHKTDHVEFKAGFENRRMNVTMLFGEREVGG